MVHIPLGTANLSNVCYNTTNNRRLSVCLSVRVSAQTPAASRSNHSAPKTRLHRRLQPNGCHRRAIISKYGTISALYHTDNDDTRQCKHRTYTGNFYSAYNILERAGFTDDGTRTHTTLSTVTTSSELLTHKQPAYSTYNAQLLVIVPTWRMLW